jgi:AmmeMemoRadiSam system protein A
MEGPYLPLSSRRSLLKLARRSVEHFVRTGSPPVAEIDDPYLCVKDWGVFVSLHNDRELRGCVGTIAPKKPLYESVIEMAQAAASRDNRVPPVRESELDVIRIDISILSAPAISSDPLLLEVGKHGVLIARGDNHGVLLPQVATVYGWDIKTLLEETCLKAGLHKDAWREPDSLVSSFTTLIIAE